jgi:hypothetical protein
MVTWSDEDVRRLNELHWHEKTTICPACGATVHVHDSGEKRPVPLMMAWCPGCHREAQFPAAAEEGTNFSIADAARFLKLHLLGSPAYCPHDGTTLTVEDVAGMGAWRFRFQCPRCAASAEVDHDPRSSGNATRRHDSGRGS